MSGDIDSDGLLASGHYEMTDLGGHQGVPVRMKYLIAGSTSQSDGDEVVLNTGETVRLLRDVDAHIRDKERFEATSKQVSRFILRSRMLFGLVTFATLILLGVIVLQLSTLFQVSHNPFYGIETSKDMASLDYITPYFGTKPQTDNPRRRVLWIVSDGFSYATATDPGLDLFYQVDPKIRADTAILKAQCQLPSFSHPNDISLITGTPPEIHGVWGNKNLNTLPMDSIFAQLRNFNVSVSVSGGISWADMIRHPPRTGNALLPTNVVEEDPSMYYAKYHEGKYEHDKLYCNNTIQNLLDPARFTFNFAYLGNVDAMAHSWGTFTQRYKDAVKYQVNTLIRSLFGVVDNDTVIVLTADHGHVQAGGHGGNAPIVREIPVIVYQRNQGLGTTVPTETVYSNLDISPTLAALVGVPVPRGGEGQVITPLVAQLGATARDLARARLDVTTQQARLLSYFVNKTGQAPHISDAIKELARKYMTYQIQEGSVPEGDVDAFKSTYRQARARAAKSLRNHNLAVAMVLFVVVQSLLFLVLVKYTPCILPLTSAPRHLKRAMLSATVYALVQVAAPPCFALFIWWGILHSKERRGAIGDYRFDITLWNSSAQAYMDLMTLFGASAFATLMTAFAGNAFSVIRVEGKGGGGLGAENFLFWCLSNWPRRVDIVHQHMQRSMATFLCHLAVWTSCILPLSPLCILVPKWGFVPYVDPTPYTQYFRSMYVAVTLIPPLLGVFIRSTWPTAPRGWQVLDFSYVIGYKQPSASDGSVDAWPLVAEGTVRMDVHWGSPASPVASLDTMLDEGNDTLGRR